MDLISVIMPVYNGEACVSRAVESILSQTYSNLEFIVIDDGSTDRTCDIVSDYAQKDQRVKLYKNKLNLGLTKSLNKAIGMASGNYIARQDADDQSDINRLSRQLEVAKVFNSDLVLARGRDSEGRLIPSNFTLFFRSFDVLYRGNCFIHGTYFGKSSVFKCLKYDEEFKYAQDYNFLLRVLKSGKKVSFLDEELYKLTTDGPRISRDKSSEQKKFADLSRKNILKIDDRSLLFSNSKWLSYLSLMFRIFWHRHSLGRIDKLKL